jgi:hypothetical protein
MRAKSAEQGHKATTGVISKKREKENYLVPQYLCRIKTMGYWGQQAEGA